MGAHSDLGSSDEACGLRCLGVWIFFETTVFPFDTLFLILGVMGVVPPASVSLLV